jgi:hypothetical protein
VGVAEADGGDELLEVPARGVLLEAALGDAREELPAADELHGEVDLGPGGHDLEEADDVGAAHAAEDGDLALDVRDEAIARPSPPAKPRLLLLLGFRELSTGSSTAGEGRAGIKGERRVADLVGARGLRADSGTAGAADSGTVGTVASRPLQLCGRDGDCGGAADSGIAGAMTAAGTACAGNRGGDCGRGESRRGLRAWGIAGAAEHRGRGRTNKMWTPTLST